MIGIDFGSDSIRVSVIKPGKKLIIVENEESKRTSFNFFAFNGKETLFNSKALFKYMKNPEHSVKSTKFYLGQEPTDRRFLEILNKTYSFTSFSQAFNGGVSLDILGKSFVAEEAAGRVLQNLAKVVDTFAGTSIKDCVISIPSSFTRQAKHALMSAVRLADLNLLSLVYDNSAAAVYFSLDQVNDQTDRVVLIVNIGDRLSQVSLVSLWGFYENGKYNGRVQVLAHKATDRFAGYVVDYELVEIIVKEYYERNGVDLKTDNKVIARLWKEVNSAKVVLSASRRTEVFVEGLVNGIDLKFELTQEMVEEVVGRLGPEVLKVVDEVLGEANVDWLAVGEVELIGGASKIPKIQKMIEDRFGVKTSFHIHPTEAVAYGAALLAAQQSATVTTSPFTLTDVFPCEIEISTLSEKTILFDRFDKLKQKKTIEVFIPESNEMILNEICREKKSFYSYKFTENGPLSLTFTLDHNGFAFLNSAKQEGSLVKFTTKEISRPSIIPEEVLEKIFEDSKVFLDSAKESEMLAKAKNDVESILYFLKDKLQEVEFNEVMNDEERKKITDYTNDLESWMNSDAFQSTTEEEIKEKIWQIRVELISVLEKENDLKVREKIVQEGRNYIEKLKTFMNMVNETVTWIPKAEIDEGFHVLHETEKWLNQKISEQKTKKNSEPPAISSKEFDDKFMFLRSQIEKFATFKAPNTESKPE